MACTPSQATTELQFVQALGARDPHVGECCGPMLRIGLWGYRLLTLERIFDSQVATDILWGGMHDDGALGIHFSLCAAHWMDLASLVWMRSQQSGIADWYSEADHLLRDVCAAARWDPKEIVNMFAWQRHG